MLSYIFRRLLVMIPTLIGITFLVFMLIALSPGGIGAAIQLQAEGDAGDLALQEAYLEDRYGLGDPVIFQYVRWLGRISPLKFGTRDQIAPTGELIRPPRFMDDPPLWEWFVDDATQLPVPHVREYNFDPDATETERDRIYRRAANTYSRARADFIRSRVRFNDALATYAPEIGYRHAIRTDGDIRYDLLAAVDEEEHDFTSERWTAVQQAGEDMLEAYEAATEAQAELAAIFYAEPYPEAGYGISGVISVAAPDLGVSFARSRAVSSLIRDALPVTLMLNLIAIPIIYFVAIPAGMLAAVRRGKWQDVSVGVLVVGLWAIPIPWAGVLALGFLANNDYLGWFPVSGLSDGAAENFPLLPQFGAEGFERGWLLDRFWHLTLPIICLIYTGFAILSKQTRAAMLENLNADYVRTARAKGVPRKDIIFKHVFRNSLLPLITLFVMIFPAMLSGSVVIESIFTIPGMGWLVIEAIHLRDREVILATTTIIAMVNILALLLADILYAVADPRITYS